MEKVTCLLFAAERGSRESSAKTSLFQTGCSEGLCLLWGLPFIPRSPGAGTALFWLSCMVLESLPRCVPWQLDSRSSGEAGASHISASTVHLLRAQGPQGLMSLR